MSIKNTVFDTFLYAAFNNWLDFRKKNYWSSKVKLVNSKKNFPKAIYKFLVSSKQAGTLIYGNDIYIISGMKNPPVQTVWLLALPHLN